MDRSELKKNEVDLFNKWKKTKDPIHFQQLYSSMKNMVYDAARKASFGSNLPESAHRAYAAQAFYEACRTFNPQKEGGAAALQSHIYGSVQNKVKRLNYTYSNLGHMPEPRMQKVGLYQSEYENLRAELNREPSQAELADRLGWGLSDVARIQVELKKDLAMDQGTEEHVFFETNRDEELLDYLYFDLGPQEKVVYEYIFGKHGKQKMVKNGNRVDYDGIAKQMGVSSSKVRMLTKNIATAFEKVAKK